MTHSKPAPAPMTADEIALMRVQTWTPQINWLGHDNGLPHMVPANGGMWVSVSDYTTLTAELATERQARKQWQEVFERAMDDLAFANHKNEAQAAEIERLRSALEWYADEVMAYSITQANEPSSAVHGDRGKRARAALEASK